MDQPDQTLFADLRGKLPSDPELMEAEREQLRFLSTPGGPIWKIVKSALEHADFLKEQIAMVPLINEDNIKAARDMQIQRQAAINFLTWFVQCFAPPVQQQARKQGDTNA